MDKEQINPDFKALERQTLKLWEVENIEKIANLICNPPKLLETGYCTKEVKTIPPYYTLKETISKMASTGYRNIPVCYENELFGVANGQKIIELLGNAINQGRNLEEYISETTVNDFLLSQINQKYYDIESKEITLDQVVNMFYENRKLLVVLITEDGTSSSSILGVVTVSDIIDINNIMYNYDRVEKIWTKNK